jgi:hypothetical protein
MTQIYVAFPGPFQNEDTMPTFPKAKDDIGYESGGWPATDLPAALAARPVPRRRNGRVLKWAAILMVAAGWFLLLYFYYHRR